MGLALQIIGVLVAIASLIFSIISIFTELSSTIGLVCLVVGISLVRLGRSIYNNSDK